MTKSKGAILSERVMRCVTRGQQSDEELFRRMIELLAGAILRTPMDSDVSLLELEEDIDALYTYDEAYRRDGFDVGAYWGMLELYRECVDAETEFTKQAECTELVRRHFDLFCIIDAEPGITQGELAKRLGLKKSNFSQILARLAGSDLYVSSLVGRTKHLYITQKGRAALGDVREEMLVHEDVMTNRSDEFRLQMIGKFEFTYDTKTQQARNISSVVPFVIFPAEQNAEEPLSNSAVDGFASREFGANSAIALQPTSFVNSTARSNSFNDMTSVR